MKDSDLEDFGGLRFSVCKAQWKYEVWPLNNTCTVALRATPGFPLVVCWIGPGGGWDEKTSCQQAV